MGGHPPDLFSKLGNITQALVAFLPPPNEKEGVDLMIMEREFEPNIKSGRNVSAVDFFAAHGRMSKAVTNCHLRMDV